MLSVIRGKSFAKMSKSEELECEVRERMVRVVFLGEHFRGASV
jgi:hypothetical protein